MRQDDPARPDPARRPVPPRRRAGRIWLRILLVVAAFLVLLPAIGAAALWLGFSPGSLTPRIEAAARRATGRDLVIKGGLHLIPGFAPVLEADDVALANVPGGTRPQMATIGRLRVQVALLPLLSNRVEIDSLTLVHPDILLERGKDGRPNWQFRPAAAPPQEAAPSPATPAEAAAPRGGMRLDVRRVRIEDGRLSWRQADGAVLTVQLPRATLTQDGDGGLQVSGQAVAAAIPFTLHGQTGPLAQLEQESGAPWPVAFTLDGLGGQVQAQGALRRPAPDGGYDFTVTATVPDLSRAATLTPGLALPALRGVSLIARISAAGGSGAAAAGGPVVSNFSLRAGASDLAALVPGLVVQSLDLTAPDPAKPAALLMQGSLRGAPLTLAGMLGPAASLLPGGTARLAVDLSGTAAGVPVSLKGSLGPAPGFAQPELALETHIPDLAALSPLAGTKLPPLRDITLRGRAATTPGGGFALRDLSLTLPQGDVTGEAGLTLAGRPDVTARLVSKRLDLDALDAALHPVPPAAPATGNAAPAPPPGPAAAPPPPSAGAAPRFAIPDTPLPFPLLHLLNADLQLSVADLRTGGEDLRNLVAHLVLRDGTLTLAPFAALVPGGGVTAKLSADAREAVPRVALDLTATGGSLGKLLRLLGQPPFADGPVMLRADLHGAGASPHAIAGSLDGSLAFGLTDGEIDDGLLARLFGNTLRAAKLPAEFGTGRTKLRCLALRAEAQHGAAALRTLVINTAHLQLGGDGTLNLGQETLDLHLRPLLRLGGTGVAVPVKLGGTFLDPKPELDALRGLERGRLGFLIGRLSSGAGTGGDPCDPAMAAVRAEVTAGTP